MILRFVDYINESNFYIGYPTPRGGLTIQKIEKYLSNVRSKKSSSNLFDKIRLGAYRELKKFSSPQEIMDNMYWHGTGGYVSGGLRPGYKLVRKGYDGGGGYGDEYHTISVSKSKNVASNFTASSNYGRVHPVLLLKGANVISMPEVQDSNELEDDVLIGLWERKIDAVKIGNWSSSMSEQELAVINPKCIMVFRGEDFGVYGKKRFENPPLESYVDIYNTVNNNTMTYADRETPLVVQKTNEE